MSIINITNLTFAHEGSSENLFENTSLHLDTTWKLGFVGRNGRGKTTFLRLLQGQYAYSGTISASVSFSYFPFPVPNPEENTLAVMEQLFPEILLWELLREFSFLQLPEEVLYRPFSTLSKGEQTKALLAVLFLKENSFLLIDEPTNHLDQDTRCIVSEYLHKKSGFIVVSHDRLFLDECIDHVLSLNKTSIEVQKGNFSTWWENKKRQDAFEQAEYTKHAKEVKRLSDAARQTTSWSNAVEKTKFGTKISGVKPDKGYLGHKSAKMMKRAKTIEKRQQNTLEEKTKLLKNIESTDTLKLSPLPYSNQLIALRAISIFYGEKAACKDIHLTIDPGERIALSGKNGSGKTSLLKLICGEPTSYTGQLEKSSRLLISYVSQDTSHLHGRLEQYTKSHGIDESLLKAILRKLGFERRQLNQEMSLLSGGEKKKILIARSLCEKAHLYVWDEPLNDIDLLSRMQLEELLLEYQPSMLFVEHDEVFCQKIATRFFHLENS